MATNPFAGAGLDAFGGDAGRAQGLARSAYEKSNEAYKNKPTLIGAYLANLIPGTASIKPVPPKVTANPIPPYPSNIWDSDMQMAPPESFNSGSNIHSELQKRLSESRNDWEL